MSSPGWYSLDLRVTETPPLSEHLWRTYWDATVLPGRRELLVHTATSAAHWPAVPAQAQGKALTLMESDLNAHWFGNELWLGQELYLKVGSGEPGSESSEMHLDPNQLGPAGLMLALTEVHRAGGWLPLHACVVARDGQAVVISGVSGAGKSTALLRLAYAGFEVIAEDRAFWHAETGQVVGLDRHLRAFTDSLERFAPDWLARLPLPQDVKGKWMLPLETFTPAGRTAQLKSVLLLEKEQPEQTDLSGPERVKAVWELTGWPLTAQASLAVQRGVTRLLPLIHPQVVSRETVVPTVTALLGSES